MLNRYFDLLITQRSKLNLLSYELTLGGGRNPCIDPCHSFVFPITIIYDIHHI